MKQRRRLALAAFLVLLIPFAYWFTQRRTMGVRDALNPVFWYRRARGLDLFDEPGRVLLHGNRGRREVALTIDDGPYPQTGEQLLDLLKERDMRATFFVVGDRIKEQPEQITRMLAAGHEVGNHTQTHHHRLDSLLSRHIRNEINYCDVNFNRVTDRHLTLLRPPGVRYNDNVLNVAKALGYVTVSWTCGAKDYEAVTTDFIVDRVLRRVENGSIILLHDGQPATVAALPRILEALKRDGYELVTIREMLAHLPKPVLVK